jgi:hypothetical protein
MCFAMPLNDMWTYFAIFYGEFGGISGFSIDNGQTLGSAGGR